MEPHTRSWKRKRISEWSDVYVRCSWWQIHSYYPSNRCWLSYTIVEIGCNSEESSVIHDKSFWWRGNVFDSRVYDVEGGTWYKRHSPVRSTYTLGCVLSVHIPSRTNKIIKLKGERLKLGPDPTEFAGDKSALYICPAFTWQPHFFTIFKIMCVWCRYSVVVQSSAGRVSRSWFREYN